MIASFLILMGECRFTGCHRQGYNGNIGLENCLNGFHTHSLSEEKYVAKFEPKISRFLEIHIKQ